MDDIQKLWQDSNDRLAETIELNKNMDVEIRQLKVQKMVSSMAPAKLFTVGVGIIWVAIFGPLAVRLVPQLTNGANPFFVVSLSLQVLITAIAILIYCYQLIKIQQVSVMDSIVDTQEQLASLKLSTLLTGRALLLQIPLWTTFYWNEKMLVDGNWFLWIMQGSVTLATIVLSVWLFRNITFANKDKKWFRLLFTGAEWTPLMKSMDLLQQVSDFKKHS